MGHPIQPKPGPQQTAYRKGVLLKKMSGAGLFGTGLTSTDWPVVPRPSAICDRCAPIAEREFVWGYVL